MTKNEKIKLCEDIFTERNWEQSEIFATFLDFIFSDEEISDRFVYSLQTKQSQEKNEEQRFPTHGNG